MINLQSIQTEVDASYLYGVLAEHEKEPAVAEVFREMCDIEKGHALAFLAKNNMAPHQLPSPSRRAKTLKRIGQLFGYDYLLGVLLDTEKSLSSSVSAARKKYQSAPSLSDTAHVSILKNILASHKNISGTDLARFEKHHRSVGGNALRAAVLGGNDGLVSNFSLVMGVAGAASSQSAVLLTGIAGLLAGALSMALGEWISVKSSQELYENQMQLELDELEANPEGEERELALIYQAKGIPREQALQMAADIMSNKEQAHEVLIREELGINAEDLKGSAWEAAISSFLMFGIGAILPVIPFFFTGGTRGILFSATLSTIGLFLIGAAITLFTGRSVWKSGFRQVVFGLLAAAVTFGIGRMIGVELGG
jgi:VIT1/CCC1 family predicted Fe2+/Mn2+ transporter